MSSETTPGTSPNPRRDNLTILHEAARKGEVANFADSPVDREGFLVKRPAQAIDASLIQELMTQIALDGTPLPIVHSAGIRIFGAAITGTLNLRDAIAPNGSAMPRLELIQCWFDNEILLDRCRMRSLYLRGCAFTELQASESVIEGPVDISRSHTSDPDETRQCWVVFAGARIHGRINAAHSVFKAPDKREKSDWVLYSKHSRYALDLRGTHISGSLSLRPAVRAIGGICLTLSKVEGSVWMNGADLEGVEDSAFAADYAEIKGSCYFRPYDAPSTHTGEIVHDKLTAVAKDFTTKGCISLFAAKIGGSLLFEGAKLSAFDPQNRDTRREHNAVINASTAVIGGHCLMRSWISELAPEESEQPIGEELVSHFIGDGAILLAAASIGNDLDLSGARIRSISANNIRISGNCRLTTYSMSKVEKRKPFLALYAVNFEGAMISGDFVMDEARIGNIPGDLHVLAKLDPAAPLIDPSIISDLSRELPAGLGPTPIISPGADPAPTRHKLRDGIFANGIKIGGKCRMGISDYADSEFGFECIGDIEMREARLNNSLYMDGAWIIGFHAKTTVDLSGLVVDGRASFRTWTASLENGISRSRHFALRGNEVGLRLTGAKIALAFSMNGAQLYARRFALTAENLNVGGKTSLGTFENNHSQQHEIFCFKSWGKINLISATIKLGLDMSGAKLHSAKVDVSKENSKVADALDLTRLSARYVRLCGHDSCIDGGSHSNEPFRTTGKVMLDHAEIDTQLTVVGSEFDRQLSLEFAKIGGEFTLKNVLLSSTYARRRQDALLPSSSCNLVNVDDEAQKQHLARAATPDLSLRGAEIGAALKVEQLQLEFPVLGVSGKPIPFIVDLRGAHVGALEDQGGEGWGSSPRLWLEGFRYTRLPEVATACKLPRARALDLHSLWDPSWIDERQHHTNVAAEEGKNVSLWEHRAMWLRLQYFDHDNRQSSEFSPDAYEQAVKGLNETGSYDDARRIASIKLTLDAKNRRGLLRNVYGSVWLPFRIFFDYGFSMPRALVTLVIFISLGTYGAYIANYGFHGKGRVLVINLSQPETKLFFHYAHDTEREKTITLPERPDGSDSDKPVQSMYFTDPIPCNNHVQSLLYALDVFVPVLDLRQQDACSIVPGATGWKIAQALYAVSGWIISSLTILTATGLLRKHLEK